MAIEKKPSIYSDRGSIGSADELDEYGVWVKSEPQILSAHSSDIKETSGLPPVLSDLAVKSASEDISDDDFADDLSSGEFTDDDFTSTAASTASDDDDASADVSSAFDDFDFASDENEKTDLIDDVVNNIEDAVETKTAGEDDLGGIDDIEEDNLQDFEASASSSEIDDDFDIDSLTEDDDTDISISGDTDANDIDLSAETGDLDLSSLDDSSIDVSSLEEEYEVPTVKAISGNKDIKITENIEKNISIQENNTSIIQNKESGSGREDSPSDLSTQLLLKIANELSSIRGELSELKREFSIVRSSAPQDFVPEANTGEPEAEHSGFFLEEEDETIALTGDELDNILNTADFTEESGANETPESDFSAVMDSDIMDTAGLDSSIMESEIMDTDPLADISSGDDLMADSTEPEDINIDIDEAPESIEIAEPEKETEETEEIEIETVEFEDIASDEIASAEPVSDTEISGLTGISDNFDKETATVDTQISELEYDDGFTVIGDDIEESGTLSETLKDSPVEEIEITEETLIEEIDETEETPFEEVEITEETLIEEVDETEEIPVEEIEITEETPIEEADEIEETPVEETDEAEDSSDNDTEEEYIDIGDLGIDLDSDASADEEASAEADGLDIDLSQVDFSDEITAVENTEDFQIDEIVYLDDAEIDSGADDDFQFDEAIYFDDDFDAGDNIAESADSTDNTGGSADENAGISESGDFTDFTGGSIDESAVVSGSGDIADYASDNTDDDEIQIDESKDSDELKVLREEGAQLSTYPPDNVSYLEDDNKDNQNASDSLGFNADELDSDPIDLSDAVIDEPVLSTEGIDEPVTEPDIDLESIEDISSFNIEETAEEEQTQEEIEDASADTDLQAFEDASLDEALNDNSSIDLSEDTLDIELSEDDSLDIELSEDDTLDIELSEDDTLDTDMSGEDNLDIELSADDSLGFDLSEEDDDSVIDEEMDVDIPADDLLISDDLPSHITSSIDDDFEQVIPEGFEAEMEESLASFDDEPEEEKVADSIDNTPVIPNETSSIINKEEKPSASVAAQAISDAVELSDTGKQQTTGGSNNYMLIPTELKSELRNILSYMDQLLDSLPENKIEEFAKSEYFDSYKKLFKELGLV
ncbi:MAG: hypothetical protein FWC03_10030 [Treponema sp.]|nr:hypothetical protein [Treponema sp.]